MFCTCSRICSISTFISTDDRGQLQRRRLAAQRVGLALQFLDQEVQPLADFAAGLAAGARSRSRCDAQARQFLGHVDADGDRRRLRSARVRARVGAGCSAPRLRAGQRLRPSAPGSAAAGAAPRPAPAARPRRPARAAGPLAPAAPSTRRAPSRARASRRPWMHIACGVQRRLVQAFGGRRARGTRAAPRSPTAAAPSAASPGPTPSRLRQAVQLLGRGRGPGAVGLARGGQPQFDLAALEGRAEQLAQRGLEAAQLVGQLQRQVEKAAVDRAQLRCSPRARSVPGSEAAAWRTRSCYKLPS